MDEKNNRRAEYQKQYKATHRDELNAYHRKYYNQNKLRTYKRLAGYYKRKAEEMEKQEGEKTGNEENLNGRNEPGTVVE